MAITEVFYGDEVANGDIVELYEFFGALRARLILIVSTTVAFSVAMLALAFTMTPIYRGFAVLAPVTPENNSLTEGTDSPLGRGLISGLMSGASDADRETDEEMTVLRSREFTENFIKDNNLLPVLFPKLWDAREGRWKEGIKKIPTLERGYAAFDEIRKLDMDAENDFVTLQIDWPDRFKAAEWANQMAERLNDELRNRAIKNADASLIYLQKELESTIDVGTREAISRLMESQIKKKMLAHVTQDYEVRFVDKAMVADADSPQRPKKMLMVGVGAVFGALVGIAISLFLYRRELSKKGLL
jgi:uncharacterized protein involved in exopolysaccharide biosynthesis